jgi:SAM-dependent methyltransferase
LDIERLYDENVAPTYDAGTDRGLYEGSRRLAFEQLAGFRGERVDKILDLALGTGESLLGASEVFPKAKLFGIDLSKRMIEIARAKLGGDLTAFHGDALTVGQFIEKGSFDVVLVHFLLAYVDPEALLREAGAALRPGGLLSLVTSTNDSFANLQRLAAPWLSGVTIRQHARVPENEAVVRGLIERAGFTIVASTVNAQRLHFTAFEEIYTFGTESGFFTQIFEAMGKDEREALRAGTATLLPVDDEFRAVVALLRKK